MENHNANASSSGETTGIGGVRLITSSTSGAGHLAGLGKRRNVKLSMHSRSITSSGTDLITGTANIPNNTNRNNNNNNTNNSNNNSTNSSHSLIGSNDTFIHAPLQAVSLLLNFKYYLNFHSLKIKLAMEIVIK
ncbi:unnamed protein product [Onchocerca flexuosa]|uniref:Uncharacterized protein n=1 Tax=Onchocerca flexuosa TaxID=387005 RepID=A0A3P8BXQ5_9BILA|nr:unnamed protein product [Onchocerca flexuosa]